MAYKETVLYSSTPNNIVANGNFNLTDSPTNYDKIRVSFTNYNYTTGGPTAWGSFATPFVSYEFNPSQFSIGNFEGTMWNGLTTATGGQINRTCCQRSAINTTAWKMRFNTVAANTSKTCTGSDWRNTIESVIGIKYNAENVVPTKKKVLYYGDGGTAVLNNFSLSESPSAYDRIGIISNVKHFSFSQYPTQYPISRYCEVPYWLLSGENAMLIGNEVSVGYPGTLMRCLSIYTGCSGKDWEQVNGFRGNGQTVNTTVVDSRTCYIQQVIGIKL